ncbi:surface protease GP63 [Trypanosoma theileri]|uniref:leishmanolysin n=1 Tax=Trypanosoma theileri TaxID=67003 RepID=A0A1X0P6H3_9TRYP|nr:surface protease GP63 [Trypanosoma theileri]ORC92233.1 surface protease GP63 [Trypanosoma theileri]
MQLLMLLLFFVPETMAIRKVEHHCIHAESRVQRLIIGNTNTSAYSHESNNNNKRKSNNNNDNEEEEKEGLNTGYEHQKSDNARKSLQGSKSKSRVKRFNIARRNKKLSNKKDNDGKIKLKNGTETWEPLRIVVDTSLLVDPSKICTAVGQVRTDFMGSTHTCLSQDIMTLEKVWIIENVALPLAIYRVQQLLNVNPLQGPLLVTKNICGPDVTIPESHSTVGVLDADMILYAHAGGMDNSATPGVMGTIAWAAHCELNEAGRPIVGHINFVPSFIQWFVSGWEYEYYVRIIIHELLHALGFTPTFIDPMVNISERRGKSVHLVTAPAVIAAAQTHLSCPTLDGVELEDEGGSGTAWTHWERRGWMDELMAGIPSRAAISALTLAFFSSLNLYTVNMEYNETMSWSYHAGCPFLEERCVANAQRMGFEWCNDTSTAQLCTFDRLAVGLCNTGLVPNLPPYFQYFPAEPMRAGVTPLMDYCPIVVGYGNRQCTQPVESTSDDALYGFYFGTQSRCVPTHNMVKKGYTIDDNNPRCLMVRCRLGKQVEVFVGSYWLECPADGSAGVITIPAYTGYNGEIHCERAEKVCSSTLFYNPDSAASASTVDEGPLREYALDVILLLNTTVSGNKSNVMHTLGRMATVEPGMFFILLQEEITTLCKCKLGTSNIRILPEYASAAVVNGGIVVNFQLGLMIGAGSATIENMRNMYESKFMVNSVLSRIGAYITEEEKEEEGGIFTVTIASSEILPEAVIVDEITSLDQLVALGEIHLHCKGDLTGMPSLTDQKVITLLENAVRQDISQIILLTPNLIEVKHLQITGSTDLLITLTVYFPPVADGIGGNENILHLWEQLLMNSTTITITTTITSMPSPLPVLTSTVQFLSKGAPVSVTDNISSSSALSLFSADVSEVQPDSTGDSRCVVQFTGCFAVQIVILIILILIVLIMIVVFLKLCLCPKPKWRIQVETCELVVPLQEKYR